MPDLDREPIAAVITRHLGPGGIFTDARVCAPRGITIPWFDGG